jgi:hypothetical protein
MVVDRLWELSGAWALVELVALMLFYLFLLTLMRELRKEDLRPFAVWGGGS